MTSKLYEHNPYMGPRAFTKEEASSLFGRDIIGDHLAKMIALEQIVVVHGASGSGKTSLINALVIPTLEQLSFQIMPVGRLGISGSWSDSIYNIYVHSLIMSIASPQTDPAQFSQMTISHFLTNLALESDFPRLVGIGNPNDGDSKQGKLPVLKALFIDQVEEIFARPDLYAARQGFFEQLRDAIVHDPNLTIVLVIRSEYLAELELFGHIFSNRLHVRQAVGRLDATSALEAIKRPAESAGRPFAPGVAEQLVDNLRRGSIPGTDESYLGQYVEMYVLQMVCYQVWEQLGPQDQITSTDISTTGHEAFQQLYEEALQKALTEAEGRNVNESGLRSWFGTKLITEAHSKGRLLFGEEETAGLPNSVVLTLERCFILRRDFNAGIIFVELASELFIDPILDSNARWYGHTHPLHRDAASWESSGRSEGLLLRSKALQEANAWANAYPSLLTSSEVEFLELSSLAENRAIARQRRLRAMIIYSVSVLFVLMALTLFSLLRLDYETTQRLILTAQRDSVWHEQRAIVYALTGDLGEASLELELAIDQLRKAEGSEVIILEREEWLSSLRIGINPFDLTTLERLKLEEADW